MTTFNHVLNSLHLTLIAKNIFYMCCMSSQSIATFYKYSKTIVHHLIVIVLISFLYILMTVCNYETLHILLLLHLLLLLVVNVLSTWTLWLIYLLLILFLKIAESSDHGRVRAHLWLNDVAHWRPSVTRIRWTVAQFHVGRTHALIALDL